MKQKAWMRISVFGEEGIHETIEKWKFSRAKASKHLQGLQASPGLLSDVTSAFVYSAC